RAGGMFTLIRGFALDRRMLAIADVHDEGHPALVGFRNRRGADHRPDARAVLADVFLFERGDVAAPAQLDVRGLAAFEALRRRDRRPENTGIREIRLCIADEFQEALVRLDDLVAPADDDTDDVRVDEAAPSRFAL